ncbi:hypothetical protein [Uliginosibacterium sediminicola]|uniref:Uncharacterized protein n=1 Tax=Uliginosibacterium sediminicola TaxID=2024550 RepID=A0ABU9YTR5_9RHOO
MGFRGLVGSLSHGTGFALQASWALMTYCQKRNTELFLSRRRKEDASPWRDYTKILFMPLMRGMSMSLRSLKNLMQRKKSLLADLKLDCNGKLPPPYMAACGR